MASSASAPNVRLVCSSLDLLQHRLRPCLTTLDGAELFRALRRRGRLKLQPFKRIFGVQFPSVGSNWGPKTPVL